MKAAHAAALKDARSIMCEDLSRGTLDLASFIEVEDENRKLLFTLTFDEAVDVKRR